MILKGYIPCILYKRTYNLTIWMIYKTIHNNQYFSKSLKAIIYILLFFLGSIAPCIGQQSDYIYTNYTVSDGLPSNECYDVIQDKSGYVWVATDNGVAKFDGIEFKSYGQLDGLRDDVIFTMREDSNGHIWMAGFSGEIYIYDPILDMFHAYKFQNIIDQYIQPLHILKEFSVMNGDLIVGIEGKGFLSIDKAGKLTLDFSNRESGYSLNAMFDTPIIISEYDFTPKPNCIDTLYIKLKGDSIERAIVNSSNSLGAVRAKVEKVSLGYLISFGNIVKLFDHNGDQLWESTEDFIQGLSSNNLGYPVICLAGGGGVRKYTDILNGKYVEIISGIAASNFLHDNSQGYWITSTDKGLFHIKNTNIKYVSHHQQSNYYTHLKSNGKGSLYMASYDGLIERLDLESRQNSRIHYAPGNEYKSMKFDTLYRDLWFSNNGLTKLYNEKNGSINQVVNIFNPIDNMVSSDYLFDTENILVPSSIGSLFNIDRSGLKTNLDLRECDDSLKVPRCYDIERWGETILLGSQEGVLEYSNGALIRNEKFNILSSVRIEDIEADVNGDILFGTKGFGVVYFDERNQQVLFLNVKEEILDNNIEDVEIGPNGDIYIATLKGISVVKFNSSRYIKNPNARTGYTIKNYTQVHGLPSPDVYDVEIVGDMIYAATGKGVIEFKEEDKNRSTQTPRIIGVDINGQAYSFANDLNLNYDQNYLKIKYSCIDIRQGKSIKYGYSINNQLYYITSNQELDLIDLSPDSYSVKISAQNEDGIWGEPVTFNFEIKPPWWKTWWFYLLVLIGVFSFIYYYFRSRELALRKETAIKDELRSLEKAALQSQMNPHFIFNSLNSIQNFIMSNDKMAAMDYLGRFAKLIRLTLNASNENTIPLYDEIQMLEYYLSLEKLRFKSKFDYEIIISDDTDVHNTYLPPMLMQPLAENAVKHGMNGIHEGGVIEVRIGKKAGRLFIVVRDNGPMLGINMIPNTNQASEECKKHRSLGMRITGKRLNMGEELDFKQVDGWTEVEVWV